MASPIVESFVWFATVLAAYLSLDLSRSVKLGATELSGRLHWKPVLLFALAVTVRIVPALMLPNGAPFDIESYAIVADLVRHGQDVYRAAAAAGRYPYLPLQMYLMAAARVAALRTGLPFPFVVKLPAMMADGVIAAALYRAGTRAAGPARGATIGLLYALNPITLLVSAYHGQFDSLPALCSVLAWYWLWSRPERSARAALIAGALLGLGILDKTWPIIFLPPLVLRVQGLVTRIWFTAGAVAIPTVGVAVYVAVLHGTPAPILRSALGYDAVVGWWGYTAVLNALRAASVYPQFFWLKPLDTPHLLALASAYGKFVTVGALGISCLALRRSQDALGSLLTTVLLFFVVTAGFGVQYLVWVVPLALLAGRLRPLSWFTAMATVFLGFTEFAHLLDPLLLRLVRPDVEQVFLQLLSVPVWLVSCAWLLDEALGRFSRGGPGERRVGERRSASLVTDEGG